MEKSQVGHDDMMNADAFPVRNPIDTILLSRFKSPNLDTNPRYTAHTVKDITQACPVSEVTLKKLVASRKSRNESKDAANDDSQEDVDEDVTAENAAKEVSAKEDTAQCDITMEDIALCDITMEEISKGDITMEEIARGDITMEEIAKEDIVNEDAAEEDTTKKDAAEEDTAKEDATEDPIDENAAEVNASEVATDAGQETNAAEGSRKKGQLTSKKDAKKKKSTSSQSGGKKPTLGEPKQIKKLFVRTFKTVSLTLGCLTGTLRRATSMDRHEAREIADRINDAAHILSRARILVFKGIELFTYRQLDHHTYPMNNVQPSLIDSQEFESSSSVDTSVPNPASGTSTSESDSSTSPMDPLDLLLDKKHGKTLIRNLSSLVINGSIGQGRASDDPSGQLARELAKQIYSDMGSAFPGVMPLSTMVSGKMSLAVPNGDMAVNIHTSIRVHFGRLPELITTKVGFSHLQLASFST